MTTRDQTRELEPVVASVAPHCDAPSLAIEKRRLNMRPGNRESSSVLLAGSGHGPAMNCHRGEADVVGAARSSRVGKMVRAAIPRE